MAQLKPFFFLPSSRVRGFIDLAGRLQQSLHMSIRILQQIVNLMAATVFEVPIAYFLHKTSRVSDHAETHTISVLRCFELAQVQRQCEISYGLPSRIRPDFFHPDCLLLLLVSEPNSIVV